MYKIRSTATDKNSNFLMQILQKIIKASASIVIAELIAAFFFIFNPKIARKMGVGKNVHPLRDK